MAGWRQGFDSPQHQQEVVGAIKGKHALCPRCRFDLIDQRRPDCPECRWPIDAGKLIFPDEPPGPLLIRLLAAAVACAWLAIATGVLLWPLVPGGLGVGAFFAAQAVGCWKLMTIWGDRDWWQAMDDRERERWIIGSMVAIAVSIGAVLITAAVELTSSA